jgi:hypothetical protein
MLPPQGSTPEAEGTGDDVYLNNKGDARMSKYQVAMTGELMSPAQQRQQEHCDV